MKRRVVGPILVLAAREIAALQAFGRRHPEWLYYAVVTGGMSLVGGFDIERFAVWLLPFLVVFVAFARSRAARSARPVFWFHGLALHVAAMGALIPWDPYDRFYLALYATHIDAQMLPMMLLCAASSIFVAVAMLLYDRIETRDGAQA